VKAEALELSRWILSVEDDLATRSSLLCRLQDAGDHASWQSFFDSYWRLIYNVARKAGLSDADAQDVVQDTIIAVARKMPQFRYDRSKGSFKQWLLLITRRRIQDHLRRLYRLPPFAEPNSAEQDRASEISSEAHLAPDAQIEAAWEYEWQQNLIQRAMARVRQRVNPKHYQVFDVCVLKRLPTAEAARMFGLAVARVYLIKHRVGLAVKQAVKELELEMEPPARS
jgi:RNA polymerase sigma factor (sigma-70 family)